MSAPATRRAAAETDIVRQHASIDEGATAETIKSTPSTAMRWREHRVSNTSTDCDESMEAANVSAPVRRRAAAKANTVHRHASIDEGKNMEVAMPAPTAARARRPRTCRHQRDAVLLPTPTPSVFMLALIVVRARKWR